MIWGLTNRTPEMKFETFRLEILHGVIISGNIEGVKKEIVNNNVEEVDEEFDNKIVHYLAKGNRRKPWISVDCGSDPAVTLVGIY